MTIWQNFKQKLAAISAILIGILTLAFFFERSRKEAVEEELLNKETADKDKELKDQQTVIEQDTKAAQAKAEQDKAKPITEQEALETLDKL